MNKRCYIRLLSRMSGKYGELLVEMMWEYNCINLQEITFDQAREYYEKIKYRREYVYKMY